VHPPGLAPAPRFDAAAADRYEGDDSWFQATTLVTGEAQGHSLGDSANPRGDEDWFVFEPTRPSEPVTSGPGEAASSVEP